MNRWLRIVVTALLALAVPLAAAPRRPPAPAPTKPAAKPAAAVPPLIDRELFFGNPEIAGAQLSPDGQYIAFLKPWKDTRNIWVKKTREPFDERAAHHRRDEAARSRPSSGAATAASSSSCRTRTATRTTTSTPSIPRRAAAAGKDVPAGAQPHRRQGRARGHLRRAEEATRHDLRRPQRPRRRLARPLQGEDLDRRARSCCARTPSGSPAGSSTSTDQLRLAAAHGRQRRHRDPAGRPDGLHEGLLAAACSRPAAPLQFHKDGKRVYMETNKGERRPDAARALRPRDREGGARRVRSAEAGGLRRRRSSPRRPTSSSRPSYEDDRHAHLLPRQGLGGRLQAAQDEAARQGDRASARSTADEQRWMVTAAERHRARRALPLRPRRRRS